ncbi:MAG: peptidoglycan-binding protein [Rhizobiaceae bacterium]|nr:peptidoglycan-binding protein [Rhizobiaceae bacterium]
MLPVKCNPPLKRINGICKLPGFGILCIPPKKMFGGVCRLPVQIVCAPPRVRRGAHCVLPNPSCHAPFVRSPITNRCYLPFEVDLVPEAECRPPWFYSERSGGCVKLRPRPRARENIVWVQSCLNTLGYRAGVEDGISGRQTRSAWQDFRRALNLRGIVGFDDPETLGALYRECNSEPAEVAEPRPTETAAEPPTETATPASDLKYRQSMCATGKLYSLLNETYGGTIKLEQCGGRCLPIPEGMAESDVRRLETDQGIQWCKDCVKIGDEGILCPAPALQ